jgi:O-antigen/teichoic acid export membrane protein
MRKLFEIVRQHRAWFLSAGANLLLGSFGVLTASLLAHGLHAEGRGILAKAMLWPGLIFQFFSIINPQALSYFWVRMGSPEQQRRFLGNSLTLSLLFSGCALACALLINWLVLGRAADAAYGSATVFVLGVPALYLGGTLASALLAAKQLRAYWGMRIANAILYAAALGALALAHRLTPMTAVLSITVTTWLSMFLNGSLVFWTHRPALQGPSPLQWEFLSFAFKVNLTGIPYQLNLRLDQLLISILLLEKDLGVYTVAFAWASVIMMLGGGLSTVLIPRSAATDPSQPAALAELQRHFKTAACMTLAFTGIVAAATPWVIPLLFGRDFIPAIIPSALLCICMGVRILNVFLHEIARGLGHPGLGLRVESIGLVFNVLLLAIALPLWGLAGAALASLLGSLLVLLFFLNRISTVLRIPPFSWWSTGPGVT